MGLGQSAEVRQGVYPFGAGAAPGHTFGMPASMAPPEPFMPPFPAAPDDPELPPVDAPPLGAPPLDVPPFERPPVARAPVPPPPGVPPELEPPEAPPSSWFCALLKSPLLLQAKAIGSASAHNFVAMFMMTLSRNHAHC